MSNIVIIDDEKQVHQSIKRMLGGVKVISYLSGEEAISSIAHDQADLILLDINMEGIDGYATAIELRKIASLDHVPILIISGLDGPEAKLKAYGAGAVDFIQKPLTPEVVSSKIKGFIRMKKQSDMAFLRQNETQEVLTDFQRTSVDSQIIAKFALLAMQCNDLETLVKLLEYALDELGAGCAIKLRDEQRFKNSEPESVLEKEILSLADNLTKIYQFGNNRALFRWKNASLLVRNLDTYVDSLAMLMDAFDAAYDSIHGADLMLQQAMEIQTDNQMLKSSIDDQFEDLEVGFSEVVFQLGLTADFGPYEEKQIRAVIQKHKDQIVSRLGKFQHNGEVIENIITDLRRPSPQIQKILDERASRSGSEDELF